MSYALVEPGLLTTAPLGAVISLAQQPADEVRCVRAGEVLLGVDRQGRPCPAEGERPLGYWDAGYANVPGGLGCSVLGAARAARGRVRGVIGGGHVRILAVTQGLRCAVGPADGVLLRDQDAPTPVDRGQAWVFWLPFLETSCLLGSKQAVTIACGQTGLATGEVRPTSPGWRSLRRRSRPSDFARFLLSAICSEKEHRGDHVQRWHARSVVSANGPGMFAENRTEQVDFV